MLKFNKRAYILNPSRAIPYIFSLLSLLIISWHFIAPSQAMSFIAPAEEVDSSDTNSNGDLPLVSAVNNPDGDVNRSNPSRGIFVFDKSPPVRSKPDISAAAYMVIDPHTGSEIISHNAHVPYSPASLAKIMTAYVVAKHLHDGKVELQAEVPVSRKAFQMEGSRMFIQPDRLVTLDQLLFGLLAVSGNDAAVAIAEFIAGSEEEFVNIMNRYAQSLGMINCNFENSHGLHHPQMLCSINDIMILARSLILRHYAFYKRYFGVKQYTYNGITQRNRNRLLFYADEEIDGIKTGNTREAGYNLLVSGVRDFRLIAGVMGSQGLELRDIEVSKLLNHAYVYYKRYLHYHKEEKIIDVKIRRGKQRRLSLGLEQDLYSTLPYVLKSSFRVAADVPRTIRAPINKGDPIGELIIFFDGNNIILRRPLVALEQVEEANMFNSVIDEIGIWLGI